MDKNSYSLSFYTTEAKKIAKERQDSAVAFYNNLYEEVKSSYENGKNDLREILSFKEEVKMPYIT